MAPDIARIEVTEFYRDRSILITGGTGFMGKVLVEKLLYSCPDIKNVFIMMRPKREKSVNTRLEEMFKLPMFNRLRRDNPSAMKKLVVIPGDITLEELGISKENRERIRKEVSVVFHCAATLRLEATLKDAINMNTLGTWRMIELAKGMTQLKVFVHLSTAFCHCDHEELEERAYTAPSDPHDLMRLVQWMDDTALQQITAKLVHPHPNTYTYSKRLSEKLIIDEYPNLPMVIARPAIVVPAHAEPVEGWVDSLNGPIGLIVGAGKGVIRSMHCNGEYRAEVIPVDFAINALIAIGWKMGTEEKRPAEIPVFNLTVSSVKDVTWGRILEVGRKLIYKFPFEWTIWYPDGNIRTNKFYHNLCVIFLHFLPAFFIDGLLTIFRQKRLLVRIQWRITEGLNVLQYFTTRQWKFYSENFMNLRHIMSPVDQKNFSLEFEDIEDVDYMLKSLLGARQYCCKEDLSSLPRCRRNIKILWAVDKLWTIFFYFSLFWLVYSYSETARYSLDFVGEQLKGFPVLGKLVHRGGDLSS